MSKEDKIIWALNKIFDYEDEDDVIRACNKVLGERNYVVIKDEELTKTNQEHEE